MPNEPFEIVEHSGRTTRLTRTSSGTNARGNSGSTSSAVGPHGLAGAPGSTGVAPASAGPPESAATPTTTQSSSPRPVEQQRVEELDDIVDRFRSNQLTKPKAVALMRPASLYPLKTAQIGRACTALTVLLGRIHIRLLSKVAAISREHAYALARSPVHVHCQSLGQLSSLDSQRRPTDL